MRIEKAYRIFGLAAGGAMSFSAFFSFAPVGEVGVLLGGAVGAVLGALVGGIPVAEPGLATAGKPPADMKGDDLRRELWASANEMERVSLDCIFAQEKLIRALCERCMAAGVSGQEIADIYKKWKADNP